MAQPAVTDTQFREMWARHPNAALMAEALGQTERAVQRRRARMVAQGYQLNTVPLSHGTVPADYRAEGWTFPRELRRDLTDGAIVIFSDAHYWPGIITTAHKALLQVVRTVKPKKVIANGDIFDGVSVCRHEPFGWSKRPSVKEELDACIERLGEVEQAVPKGCELLWSIGNHDIRFERSLMARASDFEGIGGFRLADHFSAWEMTWSVLLNSDSVHPVMVKHRNANGIHAAYNNTMKGGYSVVTGHTHALEVKPYGDWRGRRYGIQSGCLLDHEAPQTEYTENSPSHMCPGFVVLTFRDGKLLPPEICEVIDGAALFRGEVVA